MIFAFGEWSYFFIQNKLAFLMALSQRERESPRTEGEG
jgi:hypothetical protein